MDDKGAFAKLVQMFTGGTTLPTLKYREENESPVEKEDKPEDTEPDYKEGNEDVEMKEEDAGDKEEKSKTVLCYCKIRSS